MKKKTFHFSWLLASVSSGLIIGTVASLYFGEKYTGFEWIVVSVCLVLISLVKRRKAGIALIFIAGMLFGLWRGGNVLSEISKYDQLYGQEVIVQGVVSEDPGISRDGDLQMRLEQVVVNGMEMEGQLWVNTSNRIDVRRSDVVTLEGLLDEGFGNIPASLYRSLLISVNRQDFADVGRDVRDSFSESIRRGIREPEASLASGFLVGQKTALPEKLDNELRLLGLTHIVVASGYNLTILVRFARRFFAKISRFTALAFAGFLVYSFMQITGNSPSMARASLITGLSLLAWYYGRKIHPFVLIPASAAITLVINPAYGWGDVGWLLSFTSFIGIVILSPLIHGYFWGENKSGAVRQIVIETMSAQLLTLPIIAFIFGQYSPLALLANVLILPLIPLTMLLTFIGGIVGLVSSTLAPFFSFPAEILLRYMTRIVSELSLWPIASSEINYTLTTLIVSYLAMLVVIIYLWRRTGHEFRDFNVVE